MNIQDTLTLMIQQRECLLNDSITHKESTGYVYVRPFNLGLIVEQLSVGVSVGPAMGSELPTIFTEIMADANLHLIQSIAKDPEIKSVSIQQYISDLLESTESTIQLIQKMTPAI